MLFGEKGAAKTTASQFLKMLIDPSALETLTLPNDDRSLTVNLFKNWFLPFDNASHLSGEMSDTLCRAVTGGGIQQRTLYTNGEDTIFKFLRVIAMNGINCVATRPDLLDRSILLELERIGEADRRELAQIRAEFEADRAEILGGVFDALCAAKSLHPDVKLDRLPRMADFTRWGYAISEVLTGSGREFLDQYAANRDAQNAEAISADPIATLMVEFMRERDRWSGTASRLYSELSDIADEHNINKRAKAFPADPARLAKRINGIKSNLEAVGILCESERTRQGRTITLKNANFTVTTVTASQCPKAVDIFSDGKLYDLSRIEYLPSRRDGKAAAGGGG